RFRATRHICANKAAFTSYTSVGMMKIKSILLTLELLQTVAVNGKDSNSEAHPERSWL
ncbi:hypothetical protein L195_g017614, partial [Trifolium pratense]